MIVLFFEPELLLELDIPSSAGYRSQTVGQYEVNRTVPYERGDPHFIDDTGLVELAIEATVEKENIVEYNRVPVMPDEGSMSKYDMESMGWAELQEEISYGSTYAIGLARTEMKRRRVKIAGGNERLIEGMEYEADIEGAYTAIRDEANEKFALDQEAADYTETFEAQDYKTEGWEPAEGTSLIEDDTGLVYEGWIDEYGDFDPVVENEGFVDEGTAVRPGSDGDSFDSEKVTSIEALQGRDSSLRVETQGQINELFSGVIERGEQRDFESAAAAKGSDALKRGIVKEADEKLPAWREWMRIAQSADDEALYGERGGFYKELIAVQESDWKETADLLWTEGEFQKYYEHTAPVRREAFTNYAAEMGRRRGEGITTEPEWIQERRAAYVSDYEVYSQGPVKRTLGESERHLARPPRDHTLSPFLEKDPGTSVQSPLEIRKEAAARSERPLSDPMGAFREQVYQEGAGLLADSPGGTAPAFKVLSEWDADDVAFRLESEGKWHQGEIEQQGRVRRARLAGNVRDVRDSPVPEVQILQPGGLGIGASGSRVWEGARSAERNQAVRFSLQEGRQPVQSAESYSDSIQKTTSESGRIRASEKLAQQHKAELEAWGTAQAGAYEGVHDATHAGEIEALDKRSARAKTMTLNELGRSTEQHSFDTDLDVRPLDLLTPRARRRTQGLASQRTYGLELELITDLARGEMLGVLGEQVGRGLEIVDDSTIQTARSNVRVEHGVDVEFALELFTDEGSSYSDDAFTFDVLAEESADFQVYQGQYTDVPGNEVLAAGDSITRYSHELVFPIMQGQEGLDLIGETYERLGNIETELNTSMGMHVHVGAKDLSNYDLVGIWGGFAAREKGIDLMHEVSRQGAGHPYSESMLAGSSTLGELLKNEVFGTGGLSPQDRVRSRLEFARKSSLLSGQSRESFLDTVGYGDRYQKLNLRGSKYQTIEYRQPAASLDFAETQSHIGFFTDFVDQYAGKSPEWAFQKDLSLEDISSELGLVFEEPTSPGQIVLPFDVVQHSRDAGDYHAASRMGLALEDPPEAVAAQRWGSVAESVAEPATDVDEISLGFDDVSPDMLDDYSMYEESPPDLFDDVREYEEAPSNIFDDVPGDPFDDVPMYEDSFGIETGQQKSYPEAQLAITGEKYPPTASQQRALEHTYGPAVVMAGPGSGKSRTLIERLKHLSRENLATPDDVLTLVFGKKAELDLTERSREIGGDWNIKTLDAFALSIVRENFGELGYSAAPNISMGNFEGFLRGRRSRFNEWGVSGENVPEDLIKNWTEDYETTRKEFVGGKEDYSDLSEPLQSAIHEFRRGKLQSNKLDFSDALSQAGYLLESNDVLRRGYQEKFPFLQVDEFQDISGSQARFLGHLSPNLWAVGDFDQSIMSFRGGGGEAMGEMIHRGAALYNIEENFRSTPEIVEASQGFIAGNIGRMEISQTAVKPSGQDVSVVDIPTSSRSGEVISRIADEIREGEETAVLTRTLRERDTLKIKVGVELGQRGWEAEDIKELLSFETMHASKGREWQNVILPVNVLDRQYGSGRDITLPTRYAKTAADFAEEERLFFVAMSRAEDQLTIMGEPYHPYVQKVASGLDEQRASRASDFLGEAPGEVVEQIDQPFAGTEDLLGEAPSEFVEGAGHSLGSRIRSLWERLSGGGRGRRRGGGRDTEQHSMDEMLPDDFDDSRVYDEFSMEIEGVSPRLFADVPQESSVISLEDFEKNVDRHGWFYRSAQAEEDTLGLRSVDYSSSQEFSQELVREGYDLEDFVGQTPEEIVNSITGVDNTSFRGQASGFFGDKFDEYSRKQEMWVNEQVKAGKYRKPYSGIIPYGNKYQFRIDLSEILEDAFRGSSGGNLRRHEFAGMSTATVEKLPENIDSGVKERLGGYGILRKGVYSSDGLKLQETYFNPRKDRDAWGGSELRLIEGDVQASLGVREEHVNREGMLRGEVIVDPSRVVGHVTGEDFVLLESGGRISGDSPLDFYRRDVGVDVGEFKDELLGRTRTDWDEWADVSEYEYSGSLADAEELNSISRAEQHSADVLGIEIDITVVPGLMLPFGSQQEMRNEDGSYEEGGFDFNVHGSPFKGFNPWLDPTPDVDLIWGAFGNANETETDIDTLLRGVRNVRENPGLKENALEGDLALDEGFLYRLTNLETDRQYVGLSKNHPLQTGGRIRKHLSGTGSKEIAKILSEYDASDFSAEIWGIEDIGYRELGYLEQVMIERTGSLGAGYNKTPGGEINEFADFDLDFTRYPEAVPDIDYELFGSAEVALALPSEMFEEEDYFTADEESQLRGMLAARFAKHPVSTGRPVQGVRRDAPMIEHAPVIPVEHRIDLTQASDLLLQEVPGISKGVAERALGFQSSIGAFQNIEGFDEIRGMSKARLAEATPYLKPLVSVAGGLTFPSVDPVQRDATPGELLDVETATADAFAALPGIGKETAKRIVADREARGAFITPQGIGRVRGVSDNVLERVSPYLKGFAVSEHPNREAEGLLPNITSRYMGDPEVQKILGIEGSEKLYDFNVENRPGFARSERIRGLGEVMAPRSLESYHDRPGGAKPYLDVDTAGWEEFKDLPGVGESLARRIVSYREQEGGFGDYRELSQVTGVSTGLIDSWKQYFEPLSSGSGLDPSSLQRLPTSDTVLDFQIGSDTPWDIDINQATLDDWRAVPGVSGRKAHDILMHQGARGDFAGVEDLHQRVGLSSDVYQRLLPRQPIDLNQASAMQLSFLPGLGQERAGRIVADREKRGEFESFQDLGRVEGIGSSLLERLSGYRQERVSARPGMFARELTPYPTDMRGHIPSYEDDLDAEIAPLFDSANIEDVPLESGFQYSLRKYQEEHGVTVTPEDRRRRSGRQRQRTIDEIPVSEAFGYFAEDAALDAPSDLFSGFIQGAEINSEVERRLAKLEKSQEELEREIQQDKTLTVSQRTEQLGQLEDRFGPRRDRLESYEVSTSDVISDAAGRAGTSILDRTLSFAGDKLIEKASASSAGTAVKAFGSKALSGLNPLTPALAPLALVAATVAIGEGSLDAGYEEVIESQGEREKDFYARVAETQSPAGGALRHARVQRERGERQRIDDLPEGFQIEDYLNDRVITFINRKLRLLDTRGVTRR